MRGRCELHWGVLVAEPTDQQQTYGPLAGAMPAGRYPHVVDYLLSHPWAIEPRKMRAIAQVVVHRAFRGELPREQVEAVSASRRLGAASFYAATAGGFESVPIDAASGRPPGEARNLTAVLPVFGTILPRVSAMDESSGMFSLTRFRRDLSALVNDPSVSAIVLDIDSPGGSTALVQETGDEIRAARSKKTIAAVADTNAHSAAYWLFAQATPGFGYVTPSGMVGSVGVIAAHEDISVALETLGVDITLMTSTKAPFKAEGNPYEPLGAEARAEFQRMVDSYHADFRSAVARGRGVSVGHVDEQFGKGRSYRAAEAVERGMADHVGTLEDALRAVQSAAGERPRGTRAEHDNQGEPRAQLPAIDVNALGARLAAGIQGKD